MAANKGKDTMGAGVGRTLTRRGFVELAGGVAAAGGMLALAGCGSTSSSSSSDSAATTESASTSGDDSTIRFGFEAADFDRLAALMADCILRCKDVGPEVTQLRSQYTQMKYCFDSEDVRAALADLAEKTGV